jgi:hypothetical protein
MADVKPFVSLDKMLSKVMDVPTRDVYVPEWDGVVRLKTLTNSQLAAYSDEMDSPQKKRIANLVLVMWCAINEDGSALFPMTMLDQLSGAAAGPFNRLAREALDLNGVTKQAEEAAKNASGGEQPAA